MAHHEIRTVAQVRGLERIIIPFEITREMEAWVDEHLPPGGAAEERVSNLARTLLQSKAFSIDYRKHFTATAPEVFASRQANCLAFTHLFVGMARYAGVPVFFLSVRDIERFSKEGDLVVISDHIAVGYGPAHDLQIIDFAAEEGTQYRKIHAISDLTAIALFYSNRGAEQLRRGDLAGARDWLWNAVRIDPELAVGWVNLGVTLRRSGDPERAKAAYRRALEIDPATLSAYHNLAAVLRLEGQEAEAMELLELTDRGGNRNPFSYLALGDLSLRHGRLLEAERFYRKAVRLNSSNAESFAAMGLYELRRGDRSRAERWLRRAHKFDPEEADVRVALLARRLAAKD